MKLKNAIAAALAASCAYGQAQYLQSHGVGFSAGGFGQFNTVLTSNPQTGYLNYTEVLPYGQSRTLVTPVYNQQQFTTFSAGFLGSMQFHPVSWAGVELNYGYTRYSERYAFTYGSTGGPGGASIPTSQHEATGAYLFHPKHIRFQPFMAIGGGAIDFDPAYASHGGSYQWRGAGLVETGFDIPTHSRHIAFRVEGRSLFYRAPSFFNGAIGTRSWRAQSEPVVSAVYHF